MPQSSVIDHASTMCLMRMIKAYSAQHVHTSVADPEGVQWVPWNPSFEVLPSKILCANVLTLEATYFSFKVAITHDLNSIISCIDARMTYVHVYTTRSIETMSEARERIKVKVFFYSCNAPSPARDGDMLSV